VRPEDLARELGIDGKRLRGWLRGRYPRAPEEHGAHWFLTEQQIAEARRAFVGSRVRSSRPAAVCPATPMPAALARPATKLTASRPSWSQVQHHADAVLAAGLRTLLRRPAARWGPTDVHGPGVYLFSAGEGVFYVGEATAVSSRVAQHLKHDSAFLTGLRSAGGSDLSDLRVRSLPVALGRLELEEFAIACTRPTGNRMRLHSRTALAWDDADLDLWERVQAGAPRLLREGVRIACAVPSVGWLEMRPPTGPGLYIVRDAKGRPIYVGESDAMAERLKTHRGSRSYFSALRRHVGIGLLGLSFAPGATRGFSPPDESAINALLASCSIAIMPLALGRWELERELVHELRPQLNREHT
jgi:predicted GIY-YIG superfamily endonuclease